MAIVEVRPRRSSCPECRAVFRRQLAFCPIDGARLHVLPSDPLVGQVVADRYRVDSVAGDTRTNRIYRAHDSVSDRAVALRMMLGEHASVPIRCLSFAREARVASLFDHENVLGVTDSGYTDTGLPFLVTELIEARTLEARIREEAPFSPSRITDLGIQICAGLTHIHSRDVVHRCVSAGNILVTVDRDQETIKITGFRSAIRLDRGDDHHFIEPPGKVVGSAPYMSPEQAVGDPLDTRTDLFSLGVLLYQMLCGEFPFDGTKLAHAIHNRWDDPPRIAERVPGFEANPGIEEIARILMAKSPNKRYPDAASVARALRTV